MPRHRAQQPQWSDAPLITPSDWAVNAADRNNNPQQTLPTEQAMPLTFGNNTMSKLAGFLLPLLCCASVAWGQTTVTVLHAEVPAPTVIDLGVAGDSVGDQRIWHYTGTTPEDQVVMMDWIMTTTAASDQTTPLESRVTNGVFAFGEATSDRILIQGIGQYPASGSTVKVASTLERAIIGGTGSFAGATGTVMTTHLPDGTWQHVFSLE